MTKFTSINFDDFWATPEKEVQVWNRRRSSSWRRGGNQCQWAGAAGNSKSAKNAKMLLSLLATG